MIKFNDLMDNEELCGMTLAQDAVVSDNLKYHLEKQIPLSENIFRTYSDSYVELLESAISGVTVEPSVRVVISPR